MNVRRTKPLSEMQLRELSLWQDWVITGREEVRDSLSDMQAASGRGSQVRTTEEQGQWDAINLAALNATSAYLRRAKQDRQAAKDPWSQGAALYRQALRESAHGQGSYTDPYLDAQVQIRLEQMQPDHPPVETDK